MTVSLDFPALTFGSEVTFWRAITGSTVSPPRGATYEFASLEPFYGDTHIHVQRVEDGPGGIHLDISVDNVAESATLALALGAIVVPKKTSVDPHQIFLSPAGFTFCLVPFDGKVRVKPRPIRWPENTISVVDQLCIEVPRPDFTTESAFWAALTGWEFNTDLSANPNHPAYLSKPDLPLRLLIQPFNDETPCAHLDIATTHLHDEVSRHVDWGAIEVSQHEYWTVMADPNGRRYCITDRNPRTGKLNNR